MRVMRTEYIDLSNIPEPLRPEARELIQKHEKLWSGHLENINEAKHYIDLVPEELPFRSHPY